MAVKAIELAVSPNRRERLRENILRTHEILRKWEIPFSGEVDMPFVLIQTPKVDVVLNNLEAHGIQVGKTRFTKNVRLRIAITSAQTDNDRELLASNLAKELRKNKK